MMKHKCFQLKAQRSYLSFATKEISRDNTNSKNNNSSSSNKGGGTYLEMKVWGGPYCNTNGMLNGGHSHLENHICTAREGKVGRH